MILEIQKEIWLDTPRGVGIAHFMIDTGSESDLKWVCFIQETGQCWTFSNKDVTICKNITLGRDFKTKYKDIQDYPPFMD